MAEILYAKPIYDSLKERIKKKVQSRGQLTLASVLVGGDYSAQVYVSAQKKIAKELGIEYLAVEVPGETTQQNIIEKIKELNEDNAITGILLNKPFPLVWDEQAVFGAIDFRKDVEGMNPYNLGCLFLGEPRFISPTVLSILEFLARIEIDLYGKEAVIVGFSTLIGKPLAALLARKFVTVTITHIATYEAERLPFYVANADIVITAVGKPGIIAGDWIKKGAVVIDVGIGEKDGRPVGDVDFAIAQKTAGFITPVPGGVGKLTTLFLFDNVVKAADADGR
jgi:methylenetetrahydrofolate dehydrogenase (NADP+)/methenyltetrahydrofolate cyclohydrolase